MNARLCRVFLVLMLVSGPRSVGGQRGGISNKACFALFYALPAPLVLLWYCFGVGAGGNEEERKEFGGR